MEDLNTVQGVSMPRSGHHLLVNLLQFQFHLKYEFGNVFDSQTHEPRFTVGPFSYCEFYRCCKRIPCAFDATFRKNHDFKFRINNHPEFRYIIQWRHPVPQIISWYEMDKRRMDFATWSGRKAVFWNQWVERWVMDNDNPNAEIIYYDDLIKNTQDSVDKCMALFGVKSSPVAGRFNFLRHNLEDYDCSNIIEITKHHREALGLGEMP